MVRPTKATLFVKLFSNDRSTASFSFALKIHAELASHTFEPYLKQLADLRMVSLVNGMTAGNIFLWLSQSNAKGIAFSGSAGANS